MGWRNDTQRYGSLSIGLHWLMLLLFVGVYACIELHDAFPKGSDQRAMLKNWHFMLGLSIFFLAFIRVLARVSAPTPRIVPVPPLWEERSAKLMYLALYALMFAMPLAGWLLLSAAGKPIPFFGLHLPALISESKPTASLIKEIHETAGNVGYFLIAFHAAAALYHHYFQRDNTLLLMLPKRD